MSGQVFNVSPDGSTNCQVTVQSFDMFKAVLVDPVARKAADEHDPEKRSPA